MSKFSEKYNILKNARIDFPDKKLYQESFAYIVGGFSSIGLPRVSLPGNPEESINHSKFDESTFIKVNVQEFHEPVLPNTVLRFGKEVFGVDREIQEVLPSEEYSHIEHADHHTQEIEHDINEFIDRPNPKGHPQLESLVRSNELLLKDIEEMGRDNERQLGRISQLIASEQALRERVEELELQDSRSQQTIRSLEERVQSLLAASKSNHQSAAAPRQAMPCEDCSKLKEDNKDLKKKIIMYNKEIECLHIKNDELLKQIRKEGAMEASLNPELRDFEKQPHGAFKPADRLMNTPSRFGISNIQNGASEAEMSKNQSFMSVFEGDRVGKNERMLPADDRPVSFQSSFQEAMKPPPFKALVRDAPTLHTKASYDIEENLKALEFTKTRLQEASEKSYAQQKAYHFSMEGFELPKKKDFSTPDASAVKNHSAVGKKVESERDPFDVYKYLQDGLSKDRGTDLHWSRTDDRREAAGQRQTARQETKQTTFEERYKDFDVLLRNDLDYKSRREERTAKPSAVQVLDSSLDYANGRKQRKSLGSASHNRYLDKISKLYGNVLTGEQESSHDTSFNSSLKRMSYSQDKTTLLNTDNFLKQINDRINSLVTK